MYGLYPLKKSISRLSLEYNILSMEDYISFINREIKKEEREIKKLKNMISLEQKKLKQTMEVLVEKYPDSKSAKRASLVLEKGFTE